MVENWLKNEGVEIAIIVGVAVLIYIFWAFICYLIVQAFIRTGVAARKITRQTSAVASDIGGQGTKLLRVTTHEAEHEQSDHEDEKESKTPDATTTNNNNKDNTLVSADEKQSITARAKTIGGVIRSVGNMLLYAVTLIAILDVVGAPTDSFLGFMALSTLTLSLSLSRGITDFVSGLFILIEGSYNVGEICTINGIFGSIERMTLRVTYMRGLDGTLYTVPNGTITNIANHNRDFSATVTDVGITYESDANTCINILNNEISNDILNDNRIKNSILNKPCVDGIGELAGSSVNIRFLVISKPGLNALVSRISNEYVHKYLKQYLAYPTKRHIVELANGNGNDNNNAANNEANNNKNNNANANESKENDIDNDAADPPAEVAPAVVEEVAPDNTNETNNVNINNENENNNGDTNTQEVEAEAEADVDVNNGNEDNNNNTEATDNTMPAGE